MVSKDRQDAILFRACWAKCGGSAQNCKPADCLNSVIPLDTALRHLQGRKVRNEHLLRVVKSPMARAHPLDVQVTTNRLLDQTEPRRVQTTHELKSLA